MTLAALSADYDMKPCPFCLGQRVQMHSYLQRGLQYRVICLSPWCNAQGPRCYDHDEALDAWNQRTRP